jgi:hypothetical protein
MALASVESREMPVQALRHDAVTRTPENNSGGLWRHFRFSEILDPTIAGVGERPCFGTRRRECQPGDCASA